MKKFLIITALGLVFVLSGCASTGDVATETMHDDDRADAVLQDDTEAAEAARGERGALTLDALDDPDSPLSTTTFYFPFDSSEISAEDMKILEAHARLLLDNPDQNLIIEGHTDERGSAEYNLALGERRADAVKRVLTLSGVASTRIESVSFGEENPAVFGEGEEAWSQNRRAELIYTQ